MIIGYEHIQCMRKIMFESYYISNLNKGQNEKHDYCDVDSRHYLPKDKFFETSRTDKSQKTYLQINLLLSLYISSYA